MTEAKMIVCNNEFYYESVQKDAEIDYGTETITLYTHFENIRCHFNARTQEFKVVRVLKDGTKLHASFKAEKYDWVLTQEEAIRNGYRCFKAVLKNTSTLQTSFGDLIVWYTPDIPLSGGPINDYGKPTFLTGLPGLIVEMTSNPGTAFTTELIDEKTIPERPLRLTLDGILVPLAIIEKRTPTKKELKPYLEAARKDEN
ncbi:MAG: GLPGLI family protein [Bernardetiaceae bacterium]|nr:GLPGLI family protein [Bernardetiaceae bacterium]